MCVEDGGSCTGDSFIELFDSSNNFVSRSEDGAQSDDFLSLFVYNHINCLVFVCVCMFVYVCLLIFNFLFSFFLFLLNNYRVRFLVFY